MSIVRSDGYVCWRGTVRGNPVRVTLDPGLTGDLLAEVERYMDVLAVAAEYAVQPPSAALAWAASVAPAIRGRLLRAGLTPWLTLTPKRRRRVAADERRVYVPIEDARRVVEHLDGSTRRAFLLARWAGLRVPSECVALKLSHADLTVRTLTVYAPKTGSKRLVPLAWELVSSLGAMVISTADDAFMFRAGDYFWNPARIGHACVAAGIRPWPRPWQNLRASFATDVANTCGAADATRILGHGRYVAAQNYWMADASRIGSLADRLFAPEKTP